MEHVRVVWQLLRHFPSLTVLGGRLQHADTFNMLRGVNPYRAHAAPSEEGSWRCESMSVLRQALHSGYDCQHESLAW